MRSRLGNMMTKVQNVDLKSLFKTIPKMWLNPSVTSHHNITWFCYFVHFRRHRAWDSVVFTEACRSSPYLAARAQQHSGIHLKRSTLEKQGTCQSLGTFRCGSPPCSCSPAARRLPQWFPRPSRSPPTSARGVARAPGSHSFG